MPLFDESTGRGLPGVVLRAAVVSGLGNAKVRQHGGVLRAADFSRETIFVWEEQWDSSASLQPTTWLETWHPSMARSAAAFMTNP